MKTVLDGEVMISQCIGGAMLSDHCVIHGHASLPKSATSTSFVVSRKLKDIDTAALMDDINIESIKLASIDEAIDSLNTEL